MNTSRFGQAGGSEYNFDTLTTNQQDFEAATVLFRGFRSGKEYANETPDKVYAFDELLKGLEPKNIDELVPVSLEDKRWLNEAFTEKASPSSAACVTPDSDRMRSRTRRKLASFESIARPEMISQPSLQTSESLRAGLDALSSVFLICSNSLVDQKKYLPDSIVPPAEYSYDVHGEDNMDRQIQRLREEFGHLLWDKRVQRANFIAVPTDLLELLRSVWNLDGNDAKSDRINKRLVPVQTFFPNLLNYLLRSPGLPTLSDVFDSDVFRAAGKKKVNKIERDFKNLIKQTLEEMGYPCVGQEIEFYLSFMKTLRRTIVQDPHIDFKFETVDPWYVDDSCSTRPRSKRGRKLEYKERVPFIAFFPLTPDGMAVEVWEARENHREGRDGVLVHIPFGSMMIARGDVVHAGGFRNSSSGNPRCHLYGKFRRSDLHMSLVKL